MRQIVAAALLMLLFPGGALVGFHVNTKLGIAMSMVGFAAMFLFVWLVHRHDAERLHKKKEKYLTRELR